jgi:hypothetical protein
MISKKRHMRIERCMRTPWPFRRRLLATSETSMPATIRERRLAILNANALH